MSSPTPWGIDKLCCWITTREAIRRRKESGEPRPWTDDPIFVRYRFCNVRREDDRVTRWIAQHWRAPHSESAWLWFAMIVARTFNWPPTLAAIGYPQSWEPTRLRHILHRRKAAGEKIFSGAYIISTNGVEQEKVDYVIENLSAMRQADGYPMPGDTLASAHAKLIKLNGLGNFMAGQVVADLKYTPVLCQAEDWWDWAIPGPGSQRGLNRVCGAPLGEVWKGEAFVDALLALRDEAWLRWSDLPKLCLQDLQNCLCEFDKYERVRLGQGRPRATYKPETAY